MNVINIQKSEKHLSVMKYMYSSSCQICFKTEHKTCVDNQNRRDHGGPDEQKGKRLIQDTPSKSEFLFKIVRG